MPKIIYNKSKQTKLCLDWKASGLTQKAYCEQHHIHVKTFSNWLKKRGLNAKCSSVTSELTFLPLKEKPPNDPHIADVQVCQSISENQRVEIILPNSIILKITLKPNDTLHFIRGLVSCN